MDTQVKGRKDREGHEDYKAVYSPSLTSDYEIYQDFNLNFGQSLEECQHYSQLCSSDLAFEFGVT